MGWGKQCIGTQAGVPWGPGPKCSCRSREEAAPVSSHDPFWFQGHGVSRGCWAIPVAVEGAESRGPSELPTSSGGAGETLKGSGAKDQVNHIAHGTAHLSTPQGPLQHLGIFQRAEVLGFAGREEGHVPVTLVFLETPFPPTCRATLVSFLVCACHQPDDKFLVKPC